MWQFQIYWMLLLRKQINAMQGMNVYSLSPLAAVLQQNVVQPPGDVGRWPGPLTDTQQADGGVLLHLQPAGADLLRAQEDPRLARQLHQLQVVAVEGRLAVDIVNSTPGEKH